MLRLISPGSRRTRPRAPCVFRLAASRSGLRPSSIPAIAPDTRQYLEELQEAPRFFARAERESTGRRVAVSHANDLTHRNIRVVCM
jgi:hypothetical protein